MSEQMNHGLPKAKKANEVSDRAKQALVTAKIEIIRAYPFLGMLIMGTEYQFTDDIPTMAATTKGPNGNLVLVNEKFLLESLPNKAQRAFVIAHEILHIFLEHISRLTDNNYHGKLWNIATDFCINSYLVELNSKKLEMPSMGLYDKKYKDMSADQIYQVLLEENNNDPEEAASGFGGGDPSNESGAGQRPFDEISKEEVSEDAKIGNRQKVAASLSETSDESLKNMGSGAAGLVRVFRDLIESKIPWAQVLREYIVESAKSRYTYNRPSRRSSGNVIFPSMTGEHVNLVFGVDTSGSMSEKDLSDAMSELKAVTEEFDSWAITFLSCDTEANEIGSYASEEGDEFITIDKGLIGGGGTDMNPMVEFANEMETPPNAIIIITDGYIPEVDTVEDVPVILVVTRDGADDLESAECNIIKMED